MEQDFDNEELGPQDNQVRTYSVKRRTFHLKTLADICKDDRLLPNRRLLACLLAMQLDAEDAFQRNLYAAILLGEFVSRSGLKLYDADDKRLTLDPKTKIELEADAKIRDVFEASLNIDFTNLRDGLPDKLNDLLEES